MSDREKFQAWCHGHIEFRFSLDLCPPGSTFAGQYADSDIQDLWICWQAAAKSKEIADSQPRSEGESE